MDEEYAEYRCSACKKAIKSQVVTCKSCVKLFYHPGCVNKHRIYDKNRELVTCNGPFERFMTESDKDADMKKVPSNRNRLGSTGSTGTTGPTGSLGTPTTSGIGSRAIDVSGPLTVDAKIDWLIKTVKEIKNETACKEEIK